MKKLSTICILLLIFARKGEAQTGIGTLVPAASAITEVNSTNKGVLIPRLNITSKTSKAPVTAAVTPADGLLAYNTSVTTNPVLSNTLFYWDTPTSSWNSVLYFKETPKIATFGLVADVSVLDGGPGGTQVFFTGGATPAISPFNIINAGAMPGLGIRVNNSNPGRWGFVVGPGSYILETSYLLTAPASSGTQGGTTAAIANGYYNMGYLCDLYTYSFPASNPNGTATSVSSAVRVEGAVVSAINQQHRIRFIHTFQLTGAGLSFLLVPDIGRSTTSTFYDKATILSSGTTFKLTKLN